MSLYVYAWLALLLYSFAQILEKLTIKHLIKNPWLFSFLANLITAIFLTGILLVKGFAPVHDWSDVIYAAVFWAIGNIFFYLSLFYVDVSVFSPSFNLKAAFALLLGIFFLGEQVNIEQWFLIALIFISSIFVCYDEKLKFRSFKSKSMLFVFALMLMLALSNLFMNRALVSNDFWTVTFWIQIFTTCSLFFTFPLFRKDIVQLNTKQVFSAVLVTVLTTLGLLASVLSLKGDIGIPNVIISIPLSMVLAVCVSFFSPGFLEQNSKKVYLIRFASAAVMFAAAIKLSF